MNAFILLQAVTVGATDTVAKAVIIGGTSASTISSASYSGAFGLTSALSGINVQSLGAESTSTNLLTLSGTVNGVATKQSVALQAAGANTTQKLGRCSAEIEENYGKVQFNRGRIEIE